MKITVIGASGLIGTKVVALLNDAGQQTVAASRNTGTDVLTGEGLSSALTGADVLVDVVNSPSFDDDPVLAFFTASATNQTAAAKAAGVGHYVALSIVGNDALSDSGYMRAKIAQEKIIRASGLPYTIVRATQFHQFAEAIVDGYIAGGEARVPDALIQPIAGADVAAEVARAAQAAPVNGIINIGGPDKISFADLASQVLAHRGQSIPVVVDPSVGYWGTALNTTSLCTGDEATLAPTRFVDWLAQR
ncbi:MAG TPA: SDR family oxidoreductase [Mycobacterium sp.]